MIAYPEYKLLEIINPFSLHCYRDLTPILATRVRYLSWTRNLVVNFYVIVTIVYILDDFVNKLRIIIVFVLYNIRPIIRIKHDFLCIKNCCAPREVFKPESARQHSVYNVHNVQVDRSYGIVDPDSKSWTAVGLTFYSHIKLKMKRPFSSLCRLRSSTDCDLHISDCKRIIWTASSEFGTYRLCEQRRFRRACVSAQSRQNLRCSLIQAVSQEEPSDRKPDPWPLWMAGHAQLKFVMTEYSKTQIRLTGLMFNIKTKHAYARSIAIIAYQHVNLFWWT